MTLHTHHFEEKLKEERSTIEEELKTVGRKNPQNPKDWEPTEYALDTDRAEDGEVADSLDELENNSAILNQLEIRLAEVNAALEKIQNGTYGICEIGGEEIEEDRLEANPAAKTCKAHMN